MASGRTLSAHFAELRNARRSAIAGTSIVFSRPSGMNDRPVLRSSSISARDGLLAAIGAPDGQGVGRLGRDHPRDDPPVGGRDHVAEVGRQHLAVRVQDVEQDRVEPAVTHGTQVGAHVLTDPFDEMT